MKISSRGETFKILDNPAATPRSATFMIQLITETCVFPGKFENNLENDM